MSKPDLLEMLGLENPWDHEEDAICREHFDGRTVCTACVHRNIYNWAAADIWGRMEMFHVPSRSYLQVYSEELSAWTSEGEHDGPGWWAWIPDRP